MPRSAAAASDARVRPMRRACAAAAVLAAVLVLAAAMPLAWAAPAPEPVKIGIIGTGHIGGALATLWVQAGHEVLISSRHPDELKALAASLGPKARVGTPREAALFGEVVLVSVPYKALPQIGQDLKSELAGKIVLDTCNPYPERDGPMAIEVRAQGTGVASPRFLPGVRLVRAFNAISFVSLRNNAHRTVDPIAIPIAADDQDARSITAQLVVAAGFAPVVVGPLSTAKSFDVGTAAYVKDLTVSQTRAALGLPVTP
jgi:predicted dinucleotide-binding enzyme